MAPSPKTEDHHKILEVSQSATSDLIRKSYLRLSFKHHPDCNTGSNQAFQLVRHTYEYGEMGVTTTLGRRMRESLRLYVVL